MTGTAPPLAGLAPLLAEEPALRAVVNRQPAVAVPDAARAVFVAALADVTIRRPLLLAVPTGAEAERLVRDLGQFLGAGEVELFPAWETLPFERVSPSFETMGRRLRVMWPPPSGAPPTGRGAGGRGLGGRGRVRADPGAAGADAGGRPPHQPLTPPAGAGDPGAARPGAQGAGDAPAPRLVAGGYRREYQVEARGELAVRGS